ncbi:MAG: IS110 family transposase [Kangiella sp.]|nr:MAG: IS110 family transposase [Kangiella sp.]
MTHVDSQELHVSVDVGCYQHDISVGLANGKFLGRFEINHNKAGFADFFQQIEQYKKSSNGQVSVAMEGYNGHARPLDSLIQSKNYRLLNINNLKLARFKEIFPGAAKTDPIDSRKGLELFQLQQTLPLAKNVLQEVHFIPQVNQELKRLTRRRRRLVNERVSYINTLQSDLRALSPGLVEITKDVKNVWFLNFILSSKDLKSLAKKSKKSLMNIKQVGKKYLDIIIEWQKQSSFSQDIDFMSPMVMQDVQRITTLREMIKAIDQQILTRLNQSQIGQRLITINGFGVTSCAELAGEIGCIERFKKESSLALYIGMAALDNSSGKYKGSKASKQVNRNAKMAMMAAVDHNRRRIEQSQKYYDKKRLEGKKHNQAIRSLGRHLTRVIYKMLKEDRDYYI